MTCIDKEKTELADLIIAIDVLIKICEEELKKIQDEANTATEAPPIPTCAPSTADPTSTGSTTSSGPCRTVLPTYAFPTMMVQPIKTEDLSFISTLHMSPRHFFDVEKSNIYV